MSEFDFSVARDGAIARVDLNRPEEGNALTRAMMVRLAQLLRELGSDASINAIKRHQGKAEHLAPDMASEYAGTLLALVRS